MRHVLSVTLSDYILNKLHDSPREAKGNAQSTSWNDVLRARRAACHLVHTHENRTRLGRETRESARRAAQIGFPFVKLRS